MMDRKIYRITRVDAERIAAETVNFAIQQNFCGLSREAREMHSALCISVAIALRVRPARSPARAQNDDGTGRNGPVTLFPVLDNCRRKLIVRVFLCFRANIEYDGGAKEFFRRDLFNSKFSGRKMRGGIEMRAVVLEHPEAARIVTVFFYRSIRICFKDLRVTGPGNKFVVDRIAQIDDLR